MSTVELDSTLTTYYEDEWFGHPWQRPEVAVLIHGVAESSRSWFAWVPHLAGQLRVLRPDLRGFGGSTVPPLGYEWSPRAFAADLARFLDALGVEKAHVVGAKLGGTIGLQFAADYPDRARTLAVLCGPVRWYGTGRTMTPSSASVRIRAVGVAGWAAESQRARLGTDAPGEQVAWWTEHMARSDPRVCIEVTGAAGQLDIANALPRIQAPTLAVTTEGNEMFSVEAVREWQRQIPISETLVLPGDSFHVAAVQPDLCAQRVLEFIRRNTPSGVA